MERFDALVVGGGAAGMAAALAVSETGASVLLAEREAVLGGVLRQCAHRGFGLAYFGQALTGPEYAARFRRRVLEQPAITVRTGVTVLDLRAERTALLSGASGVERVAFERCVLAAGSRERTIGALPVAGTRPAGVYTAGTVQRLLNLYGTFPGENTAVLGGGDLGEIIAWELARRGGRVAAVVERGSRLTGLARNQRRLTPYQIPLRLRATVDEIEGASRVTGVIVRDLDTGVRERLPCDTLVTAVGLVPDRSLAAPLLTDGTPPWLRLCGNCERVYDVADTLSARAMDIGRDGWLC